MSDFSCKVSTGGSTPQVQSPKRKRSADDLFHKKFIGESGVDGLSREPHSTLEGLKKVLPFGLDDGSRFDLNNAGALDTNWKSNNYSSNKYTTGNNFSSFIYPQTTIKSKYNKDNSINTTSGFSSFSSVSNDSNVLSDGSPCLGGLDSFHSETDSPRADTPPFFFGSSSSLTSTGVKAFPLTSAGQQANSLFSSNYAVNNQSSLSPVIKSHFTPMYYNGLSSELKHRGTNHDDSINDDSLNDSCDSTDVSVDKHGNDVTVGSARVERDDLGLADYHVDMSDQMSGLSVGKPNKYSGRSACNNSKFLKPITHHVDADPANISLANSLNHSKRLFTPSSASHVSDPATYSDASSSGRQCVPKCINPYGASISPEPIYFNSEPSEFSISPVNHLEACGVGRNRSLRKSGFEDDVDNVVSDDIIDLGTPVAVSGSPAVIDMGGSDAVFAREILIGEIREVMYHPIGSEEPTPIISHKHSHSSSSKLGFVPSKLFPIDYIDDRSNQGDCNNKIITTINKNGPKNISAGRRRNSESTILNMNDENVSMANNARFADDTQVHVNMSQFSSSSSGSGQSSPIIRSHDNSVIKGNNSTFNDSNSSFNSLSDADSSLNQSRKSNFSRPLPDQSAFDKSFHSSKYSPVSSPQLVCPATPSRTPNWHDDTTDLGDLFSLGGGFGNIPMPTLQRQNSLVTSKVLVSQPFNENNTDIQFSRDFENEGLLGSGTFSDCYRVTDKSDGKLYAVKKSKRQFRSRKDRDWLLNEVRAMKALDQGDCAYVIHLIRAWQEGGYFYVQAELASRGTVKDFINDFSLKKASIEYSTIWHILHDVSNGLTHIHHCGLVHLDIKPANLLISDGGTIKIGDFGMAVEQGICRDDGHEGDTRYMALELLQSLNRSSASDIFSLGITLYEICLSGCPSKQMVLPTEGHMWHALREGAIDVDFITDKVLAGVICNCMSPDIKSRATAATLSELEASRRHSAPDPHLLAFQSRPAYPPSMHGRSSIAGFMPLHINIPTSQEEVDHSRIMTPTADMLGFWKSSS